jgi:hypothetical protein
MPVSSSTRSGVNSRTDSFQVSNPSVFSRMKTVFCNPSARMTWAIPLRSAMSVPGRSWRNTSANFTSGTRRGSAMMIFAPRRRALIIRFAITGCVSLVFEPTIRMTSRFSISWTEFVIAPEPKMAARPATVGACQSRAQWSMLLVPTPPRINFWKA